MYYYIVNPAAGGSKINKIQDTLKEKLVSFGISGEFAKTTGKGDAEKLANLALDHNYTSIIVVGGDETIGEVATALAKRPDNTAVLGIIPIGNDNHFASVLGINSWLDACEIIAHRKLEEIDLGHIVHDENERYFMVRVATGYFAEKKEEELPFLKKIFSPFLNYIETKTYKPKKVSMQIGSDLLIEGNIFSFDCLNLLFSSEKTNSINPQDGKLDLFIDLGVDVSLAKIKPQNQELMSKFKAKSVSLEFDKKTTVTIDGTKVSAEKVKINTIPKAVRVIVGKNRKF